MISDNEPKIDHIAVVGSGKMGSSLFDFFSNMDLRVTWITRSASRAAELRKKFEKKLHRNVKFGVLSEASCRKQLNAVLITNEYRAVSECDLIIETVTEDASIKKTTLDRLFSEAGTHSIMASNSSSIMPEELASDGGNIERLCGLHFFYPVDFTKIVEFVSHRKFNQSACDRVKRFLKRCGLLIISQDERNAFLINMLTMPIAGSAFDAAERVGFRQANEIASSALFPSGPFSLFDHVGVEIILESNKRYWERDVLRNRETYARLIRFMKIMAEYKKNIPDFRTQFLSGDLRYPQDLPGWSGNKAPGNELAAEEREQLRESLSMRLIGTCLDAVAKNFIRASELEAAAINIWGAEKGPIEIACSMSDRQTADSRNYETATSCELE